MSAQAIESATIVVPDPAVLRDYFLRLGLAASVDHQGVRVTLEHDDAANHTIRDYLQSWVDRNGVHATIRLEPTAPPAPGSAPVERPRLGDLLRQKGLITDDQLKEALVQARATDDLLGRVLVRRRFIFGDELARTLADQLDLPFVNLGVVGYERSVAALLPSQLGLRFAALPITVVGTRIRVAVADPTEEEGRAALTPYLGDFTVCVADLLEIEQAWKTIDSAVAGARVG